MLKNKYYLACATLLASAGALSADPIDLSDFTTNVSAFNAQILVLLGFGLAIGVTIWGYRLIKRMFRL